MFSLLRKSVKIFSSTYKKLLFFQLIYMLVTSFIFVPTIAYIFNRILWSMGSESLLNKEVLKIGLRYEGILGIITICIIIVIVMFLEYGVIIIISQKKLFDLDITLSEALLTTIIKIPKIFSFGILQLILFCILLIPLVDSPLLSNIFENINIPFLINSNIEKYELFWYIYVLLGIIIIYIILRWIFTLHFIIIEGDSATKAIKNSLKLTSHNKISLIFSLLIANIIIFAIGIIIISSLNFIPSYLGISIKSKLLTKFLITLSSYITIIFTLLIMPINIIFITNLFYKLKHETPRDKLKIYSSGILNNVECKIIKFFHKKKILLIFILFGYLIITFLLNYNVTKDVLRWDVKIVSHRGDRNAPENSISSIRKAIANGVDAIEVDVQITKDNILVLNHDTNLKRVADVTYKISDLDYNKILRIDIGSNYSEEFKNERIPTLEEVLIEIKGKTKLVIEIKSSGSKELVSSKVVNLIEKYDMVQDCYIQSFNYKILQEVRRLNKDIKIGQILYIATGDLLSLDVDFYTIKQGMLSEKFVKKAHKNKREVWVWTINTVKNIEEVLRYRIDGIITDYPERVQRNLLRR